MSLRPASQLLIAVLVGAAVLTAVIFAPYPDKISEELQITREGPLVVTGANIIQSGPDLILRIGTVGSWQTSQLFKSHRRYLCAGFIRKQKQQLHIQACVRTAPGSEKAVLSIQKININGDLVSKKLFKASIDRPDSHTISIKFKPAQTGLAPGIYNWWVASRWSGPSCRQAPYFLKVCGNKFPETDDPQIRIRKAKVVGCRWKGDRVRLNGPRDAKRVALTFDDGPSRYTQNVLRILRKRRAKATFFIYGSQTTGRESVMPEILADGHEIGNHTWNHHPQATFKELSVTNKNLKRMSGFKPCLFRPPYRVYAEKLLTSVKRAGMGTVLWDVDSADWRRLGANAIAYNILAGVQPGSIVLMHDGGGPREQTVAALNGVIKKLRSRGYKFVTVSELLGNSVIWSPSIKSNIK